MCLGERWGICEFSSPNWGNLGRGMFVGEFGGKISRGKALMGGGLDTPIHVESPIY